MRRPINWRVIPQWGSVEESGRRGGSPSSHSPGVIGWMLWCHSTLPIKKPSQAAEQSELIPLLRRQFLHKNLAVFRLCPWSYLSEVMCRGLESLPITCLERWASCKISCHFLQVFKKRIILSYECSSCGKRIFTHSMFCFVLQGKGAESFVWKFTTEVRPQQLWPVQEKWQTLVRDSCNLAF